MHETSGGSSYLLLNAKVTKQTCQQFCTFKGCNLACTTTTNIVPSGAPVSGVNSGGYGFWLNGIVNGEAEIGFNLPSSLSDVSKTVSGPNGCKT